MSLGFMYPLLILPQVPQRPTLIEHSALTAVWLKEPLVIFETDFVVSASIEF
ncbi:hypothetical protein ONE63_005097 [Megalurothrips usitatus]|uniref:Uncharacterized protein n=1 Tax=Megalurothrips usitatus TaxID=439358 RepID=A0AAV7XZ91_9NEOP|nr:hypothetical protein ONE63_005097 [Megalurothrips usitatus]